MGDDEAGSEDLNKMEQTSAAGSESENEIVLHPYKIAVAGTGYVGLSLAVLLAQHNDITAVDVVP